MFNLWEGLHFYHMWECSYLRSLNSTESLFALLSFVRIQIFFYLWKSWICEPTRRNIHTHLFDQQQCDCRRVTLPQLFTPKDMLDFTVLPCYQCETVRRSEPRILPHHRSRVKCFHVELSAVMFHVCVARGRWPLGPGGRKVPDEDRLLGCQSSETYVIFYSIELLIE